MQVKIIDLANLLKASGKKRTYLPGWHTLADPAVQVCEHNLLVLLEKLVGELCQYLQERQVWWWASGVTRIFHGGHSHQNTFTVQLRDCLAIFQRIQAKREGEPTNYVKKIRFTVIKFYFSTTYMKIDLYGYVKGAH